MWTQEGAEWAQEEAGEVVRARAQVAGRVVAAKVAVEVVLEKAEGVVKQVEGMGQVVAVEMEGVKVVGYTKLAAEGSCHLRLGSAQNQQQLHRQSSLHVETFRQKGSTLSSQSDGALYCASRSAHAYA